MVMKISEHKFNKIVLTFRNCENNLGLPWTVFIFNFISFHAVLQY